MDITSTPNLKPYRDYSEHEVINLYAHESGNVNKGTWVTIKTAAGNTNVIQNTGASITPHLKLNSALSSNTPSYATVLRPEVQFKVRNATSDDPNPLGIMLFDVRETNAWGESYIFKPGYEASEQQVVISGLAVPILTRGIVKLNGFSGTPTVGQGAYIGASGSDYEGQLIPQTYGPSYTYSTGGGVVADPVNVGKFLTTKDADGYALFKIEL